MENNNTNWEQSVTGVVIKDGKVLLARHTYGDGRGLLIVPGGYVEYGETPQDAVKREFFEREDVPDLTKKLIKCALNEEDGLVQLPYESKSQHGQGYLFGIKN